VEFVANALEHGSVVPTPVDKAGLKSGDIVTKLSRL
jgi:hypothetical protein